jgi:stearoyl-CoA desaturase (delta-9 desaturase)
MANYAREMRLACKAELKAAAAQAKESDIALLKTARRWLHRDDEKIPAALRPQLEQVRAQHPVLAQMYAMREELRQLWSSQHLNQVASLHCKIFLTN